MSAKRMRKSADVGRRTEPRTDRRCACAQGACIKVPTSSGGQSHALLDAVHAHKAHARKCRRRAVGRATRRST
eukprot:5528419-Pleurochrysis_carterae.AAC.1